MSMVIQSFDNLHDNRVLRYCADFEAHTLHMDTQTEAGEKVSVRFTGLLAHWFENVIQDNILFGMDEITVDGFFQQYKDLLGGTISYGFPRLLQYRGTAEAHGTGAHPGICHRLFPWAVRICTGSGGGTAMSITAYKVEAVGHDRTGKDFGYVNIMYRYGNKKSCPRPDQCEKMEVMWADESVYGPPAPGSKVGDFIQTWLMGSWDCGVFTHREIAQRLMDTFTGLKLKELAWFENPREKTLKNGKPRARRAKWLPEREVDLVYLYSDYYIDAREPASAQTDFFTVTRMDAWGVSTWFMCTPQAAEKLIAMDFENLTVKATTIVG